MDKGILSIRNGLGGSGQTGKGNVIRGTISDARVHVANNFKAARRSRQWPQEQDQQERGCLSTGAEVRR